ncbi:MAG: Rab family GTPase [Promethearchaeota archaeon]
MKSKKYDYIYKIVIGGEGGVGKTTIIQRYLTGEFIEDTKMTIGVQFHTQSLQRQGRNVSLVIWDLGGQERFQFIHSEYIKGAVAAFVMFDMTREVTFFKAMDWIELINRSVKKPIPIVLVGSKLDLLTDEEAEKVHQNANELVKELGLNAYIPTSSKTGFNVDETLHYIVDLLLYQSWQIER